NAMLLAESRGIHIEETRSSTHPEYTDLMTITYKTDKQRREVSGTVFGRGDIRITSIDGYAIDIIPHGRILVSEHLDKPGVIGKVGVILGSHNVNIAGMHVGREEQGKQAVMVLAVDDPVSDELMKELKTVEGLQTVQLVEFQE
ncbi:MAG: ACT domain-containing protein, partial [Armatimonadetes bacterium]|nr:ACT domain-containing protein [Armatimonadota bacterium]